MQNQTLLFAILGVIALAMVVQAVSLAGAFLAVRRLEERFHAAENEWRELRPDLERLKRIIENLANLTDSASEHLPRVAESVEITLNRLRGVARLGAMVLVKPLRPLGLALAFWKGLKRGARKGRGLSDRRPGKVVSGPANRDLAR